MLGIFNKRFTGIAAGLIFLGIVCILSSIEAYKNYQKVPVPLDQVTSENIEKGMIVEGDIYQCYGSYEEEYKTNFGIRTSGGERYYYAIPVADTMMAIVVSNGEISAKLDAMTDAVFAAYENGGEIAVTEPIHVKGSVCKMTSEDEGYMREYMGYLGADVNAEGVYLPYYISPRDYSDYIQFAIFGIALLIVGIVLIIITIKSYMKEKSQTGIVNTANGSAANGGWAVSEDEEEEAMLGGTNVSMDEFDKYRS